MTFGQSISTCFSNFANFQGRARRSEFWWFFLFSSVILFVVQVPLAFAPDGFLDSTAFAVIASSIVGIVLLIPFYAVGARRLHDTGKAAGSSSSCLSPAGRDHPVCPLGAGRVGSGQPVRVSSGLKYVTDPQWVPLAGTVTMFTTPWCGFCVRLKRQLTDADISFTEVDIEQTGRRSFRRKPERRQPNGADPRLPRRIHRDEPVAGGCGVPARVTRETSLRRIDR